MPQSKSRSRSRKKPTKRSPRSRKWHTSVKQHYGKTFHDKLERCFQEVEKNSKTYGYSVGSKYAICWASIKGTTKHHHGPRKSRRPRSYKK